MLPVAGGPWRGKVVEVHPRLEVGEMVPAGEVLFRVDPEDYEATVAEAEATVARAKSRLAALRLQSKTDSERLETARAKRANWP